MNNLFQGTMKKLVIGVFLTLSSSLLSYAQSWAWAVKDSGGGNMYNAGTAICVDAAGNAYYTGSFKVGATFNSCGNQGGSGRCFFTAKYDASGNCIWVKVGSSSSISSINEGFSIATDKHGNVLETGVFAGDIYFDSIRVMDSAGIGAIYVVKYNNNGKVRWVKTCNYAGGNAISTDAKGNVYVVGRGSNDSLSHCTVTGQNGWIVKLDSNGNCRWTKSFPKGNVWIGNIVTDSVGNSYIGGGDTGTAIMGNDTLHGITKGQGFVSKLDSSGNFIWTKVAKWDTANNGPYSIGIDKWDNVYIVGVSYANMFFCSDTLKLNGNDAYIQKLDKNGNCVWDKPVNNAICYGISVLPNGTSFISGNYNTTASVGTCNVSGGPGIFIAAIDSAGNCINAVQANGTTYSSSLACDKNGECYTTGNIFPGSNTFGLTNLTVPNSNEYIYLAKTNSLLSTGGVGRQASPYTFIVYPNPSAGGFSMQISQDLLNSTLFMYDVNGKQIFSGKVREAQSQIDIPSLSKGMYLLKLLTPTGESITRTVVKQ